MRYSAGKRFRKALKEESPLQVVGVVNAYSALMAEHAGFRVLYLSGAGVANISYGLPDLGVTSLDNVLEDARRILSVVDLPLLVDIDTGWGNPLTIERAVRELERAGAGGVHIEDQVFEKRCGHLPGKELVPVEEMASRIRAAVSSKTDPDFVIMARTDALETEGIGATLQRLKVYRDAGADMLFPEAFSDLSDYKKVKEATGLPILANMTEFGKTPLFTLEELRGVADIALYPLSASRAMNRAALELFQTLRRDGTQKNSLLKMQTREELYQFLRYKDYEEKLRR